MISKQPASSYLYKLGLGLIALVAALNSPAQALGPAIASLIETPLGLAKAVPGSQIRPLSQIAISQQQIGNTCEKIGNKLGSVSIGQCLQIGFDSHRHFSVQNQPLLFKEYPPAKKYQKPPKILFLSGIHGDEYSSISVTLKWMQTLNQHHSGRFHWQFLPLVNPDGLLQRRSQRTNSNNVDLNRNFIPAQGGLMTAQYRQHRGEVAKRYYPGPHELSEPESNAVHDMIEEFKPDVIVSVHAPHGILDFDGDDPQPSRFGPLSLRLLGTYPGSLGNYAWHKQGIPVLTIELEYAGIMPSKSDSRRIWRDLVSWLLNDLPEHKQARAMRALTQSLARPAQDPDV